jgi:hypothetical protein
MNAYYSGIRKKEVAHHLGLELIADPDSGTAQRFFFFFF